MTLPIMTALPDERRGYVDGADGQIHYRSQGEGPPVLLVHQAPWASIQFRHALPRLARSGLRAVAMDLPGHGMSSPPASPSIESYAEALRYLIQELSLAPVAVLGHRGGGLAAGLLAARYPDLVSRLVLDNAPFLSAEERAARAGHFPDNQDISADGSHLTSRWSWVRRVGDPDWSDETVHISVLTYFLHGPWKEHGHRAIPLFDFTREVSRIRAPTLIVGSRADSVFPSAARLKIVRPDWDYVELPGGPGMVLDRPDEWCSAVLPFLQAGAAARRAPGPTLRRPD